MKYYIIAGEASGDLHASNLMKELKVLDHHAEFRYWGGGRMQAVGGSLVHHYRDISFMGFWEVARNAGRLTRLLKHCREDIRNWRPDVVIPVDSPGFNLRMSRFASKLNIPVCYYISPQVWAWKSSRVKLIKRFVTRMITILPFEKDFYSRYGCQVDYVGHPLLDVIDTAAPSENTERIIALLPGSREQEVSTALPVFASVAEMFPDFRFVVCGVSAIDRSLYDRFVTDYPVEIVIDQTHETLKRSRAALVTSGTATLEAALLNVPQVVCYKGGAVSYFIGRRLVKVDHIALVNLIMEKEVVKELIQKEFTEENVESALSRLLQAVHRSHILQEYQRLHEKLGGPGASARAANVVLEAVRK